MSPTPYRGQKHAGPWTQTTYDILGRPRVITAPDGTTTSYTYYYTGTNVTDALNHTTQNYIDPRGRTTQVKPAAGPSVSYTYDNLDRLLTAYRGTYTTTMTYDYAGRKTSMNDPDTGYWTYTYDTLGNLKTQTDARSCITTLSYDQLTRLTGKTFTGTCSGTVSIGYTYDAYNPDTGRWDKGYRTGMTDASGSTTWKYDLRGRLTSETKSVNNSGAFLTQWGYDSADLVSWMKYPGGNTNLPGEQVSYTYNPQLALSQVYSGTLYYAQNTYDASARVINRILGSSSIATNYYFYPWTTQWGKLHTIISTHNPTTLQNLSYTYSNVGNITQMVDSVAVETFNYIYDFANRLTGVSGSLSETYGYDPTTGNLSSKTGLGTYTYNSTHKHAVASATGVTFQYDANGNMTQRVIGGTYNLSYDAENQLTGVSGSATATFVYDGDGKRVKGTVSGTTTAYIGNYYEWTGSISNSKKYYYSGSIMVAMRTGTGSGTTGLNWILGDNLGSTSITTDGNGAKTGELRYKPWGENRYTYGTTPTAIRYTGQRQDSYINLYWYGSRWYDDALGRFIQPDSIVPGTGEGGNLDAVGYLGASTYSPLIVDYHENQFLEQLSRENSKRLKDPNFKLPPVPTNSIAFDRYAYSFDNPVRYTDPSGHFPALIVLIEPLIAIGPLGWAAIGVTAIGVGLYFAVPGVREGVETGIRQAGEAASNGINTVFAKGEYVPPSIRGEAERNAYREAVHAYKDAFNLKSADDTPKYGYWIELPNS